jgi:DNA-binding NarL/FixJ family response regulator
MAMIRIVMADNHVLMREGLCRILREVPTLAVISEAGNGFEVLAQARAGGFDVLLLELDIPGRSGLNLLRQLKSETPEVRTLVLTERDVEKHALPAVRAGARGFLNKSTSVECLIAAIHCVASGRIYVGGAVVEQLVLLPVPPEPRPAHETLSDLEYAVFTGLVTGCSVSMIALDMGMPVKAIGTCKARMMEKLGVATLSQLVRYAIEQRLLTSPAA